MRAVLARRLPSVEALDGRAERIPLPDESVDAAVIGSAFHWFDGDAAVAELARVLRPGGGLAVLWNVGLSSDPPWPEGLEQLVDELRARALRPARQSRSGLWRAALDRAHDRFEPLRVRAIAHEHALDQEAFVAGVASFSFIGAMPDDERDPVLTRVRALAPQLLGDRDAAIVTYCSNEACRNSGIAQAELVAMGYTNVRKFPGGKQEWTEAGLSLDAATVA